MSITSQPLAQRGPDGLAVLGRTLPDLRGIRFNGDEGGNAPVAETPPTPAAEAPKPTPPAAAPPAAPEKVEDLPAWAQKIIADTRKEAGDHRAAAKTAADKAQKDLTEKLAVALGLKPDAATDPAALTESLTKAQQDARTSTIHLAVYKAAAAHQGNPDALLDSNTFLASVQSLDPASGDFATQVSDAIKAAVAANPNLKAARAAGASAVETPGGTGETGQITEEQLARMTPQEIADAYDKGVLKNLL